MLAHMRVTNRCKETARSDECFSALFPECCLLEYYSNNLSRQRSIVQASTAALLFLTEVFGLCTCSLQGLYLE